MFRRWIDESFHLDPETGMSNDMSAAAMIRLLEYLGDDAARPPAHPRDDMFTDLFNGEIVDEDGELRRLTREQAIGFAMLIGSAGTETVARLLGWAGADPRRQPGPTGRAGRRPLADPQLRGGAAPLRGAVTGAGPLVHRRRPSSTATTIPASSKVILITGSAGRDERAFPDADRFDIHRKFDHHLSFGYGIHFCLGAALARMEGRVALEETFKRFPEWSVDWPGRCRSTHRAPSAATRSSRSPSDRGLDLRLTWTFLPFGRLPTSSTLAHSQPALVAQRTRASDYGSEGWRAVQLRERRAGAPSRPRGRRMAVRLPVRSPKTVPVRAVSVRGQQMGTRRLP